MSQTQPKQRLNLHLRPAQKDDLPTLTAILIASFPADPEWVYRYPHATAYPEDHYRFTFQRVSDYFDNVARQAADMTVIEVEASEGARERQVIGWACWALPGSHGTPGSDPARELRFPSVPGERRDADPAHVAAYFAAMHDQKQRMFDNVYGEKQGHLCLLAVEPKFQGYGAGRLLVGDGIEKASKGGYVLTLFATGPGGRRLYGKMGFKEVGWVSVGPVEGETEILEFPGMTWKGVKA